MHYPARDVRSLRACLLAASVALFCVLSQQAFAQSFGGHISVFADPSANSCTLLDAVPALFDVYVIHTEMTDTWGILGSRFKLIQGPGFSASYVSESIAVPGHVGSVATGITVDYGACSFGTLMLATVTFQGYGTSTPCSYLDIGPDPALGGTAPITQNCFFDLYLAPSVGRFYVNPEPGQCQPNCIVATKPTTWGGVKALYRD